MTHPANISKFTAIEAAVKNQNIEWFEADLPIVYLGGGKFKFSHASQSFELSRDGLAYINNRCNGKMKVSELYRLLNDHEYDTLATTINTCAYQLGIFRNKYIAACVDGALYGLMTKYNVYRNSDLLQSIKPKFATNCSGGYVTPTHVVINLMSNFADDGHYNWGVSIANGQTGAVSLNYRSYFSVGAFTYYGKLNDRARHLSRLQSVQSSLEHLLQAAETCETMTALSNASGQSAIDIINTAPIDDQKRSSVLDKIIDEAMPLKTALDIVDELEMLSATRGFKTVCTNLMNLVITTILAK